MVHITACFLFQILEQIEYGEQFPEDLVYRSFEMFLRIFEFFSDRDILWAVFLTFAAADAVRCCGGIFSHGSIYQIFDGTP